LAGETYISWYGCKPEENPCSKKEYCNRYLFATDLNYDIAVSTLYKICCTEENNYRLFIKKDEPIENN